MLFLVVLLLFVLVIAFHELGHFIAARAMGVAVKSFFLGFGPGLSFKSKGTVFHFGLLLLGGGVEMAGEGKEEAAYPRTKQYKYKKYWQKIMILLSGSLGNFLLALGLYVIIFSVLGIPTGVNTRVDGFLPGSVAASAGIIKNDKIVAVNGIKVTEPQQIVDYVKNSRGQEITLQVRRAEQLKNIKIKPLYQERSKNYVIGIVFTVEGIEKLSLLQGMKRGLRLSYLMTRDFLFSLKDISQLKVQNFSGPVGIAVVTQDAWQIGPVFYLFFVALVSINIALFNLIPLPPLDGGKILLVMAGKFIPGKLASSLERILNHLGMIVLLILLFLVTYRDIFRSLV